MKCKNCNSKKLICKGKIGIKQRYQCKKCKKYQQNIYSYQRYDSYDDKKIKLLNAEGVGIRSMSRILGYSPATVIRKVIQLRSLITKPIYTQNNQVYEVDEMWTFIGKKEPSNYCWITYAINRKTSEVMDVVIGSRNTKNLKQVIDSLKIQNPKRIITDKLAIYPKLIEPI